MNPQETLDYPGWQWINENKIIVESDFDKNLIYLLIIYILIIYILIKRKPKINLSI